LSNVHHIVVSGNQLITDDDIISESELTTDTNIWTIKQQDVESRLSEMDLIDTIDVQRKLPWTVNIHITEHNIIGYLEEENEFHPIIGNGTELSSNENSGDASTLIDMSVECSLPRI